MTEELKPCPFCRSAAEMDMMPGRRYRIVCSVVDCATGPIFTSERRAVRAWNRRATPAPAQPEGQEDEPVAWLKDDGSEAWTNNKKRATVETMGAGGAMMAARFSRPLVEAGAAAPAEGAMTKDQAEAIVGDFESTAFWCDNPQGSTERVEQEFARLDVLRKQLVAALMAAPKEKP